MMTRGSIVGLLLTFLFVSSSLGDAPRPEGGPPVEPAKAQSLTLVHVLVKRGHAAKDPLALIEAAQVMHDDSISVSLEQDKSKKPAPLTIDGLLADAKGMASGKPDILKLIEQKQAQIGGDSKSQKRWPCYYYCDVWGYCVWWCY